MGWGNSLKELQRKDDTEITEHAPNPLMRLNSVCLKLWLIVFLLLMAPSLNEWPKQGWNDELFAVYHHQGKFMAAHITWQRERISEGLKKLGGGRGWRKGSAGNEELRHQGPHCPKLRQKSSKLCSYLIFTSTEFFLFIPRVVFFSLNKFAFLSLKEIGSQIQNIVVWAKKNQIFWELKWDTNGFCPSCKSPSTRCSSPDSQPAVQLPSPSGFMAQFGV